MRTFDFYRAGQMNGKPVMSAAIDWDDIEPQAALGAAIFLRVARRGT